MSRKPGLKPHSTDLLIHVVAGVLRDSQGRVLLAQRLPDKHLGGCWEFPGGKREPDESNRAALNRELGEELGIDVLHARHWLSLSYDYPARSVRLYLFDVEDWRGRPRGLEGQPIGWYWPEMMNSLLMPDADRPVVTALSLGRRKAYT